MVIPLILYYLTPNGISIIALAGLSAAAMSSADSAFLSSSAMFAHNVFKATKKMVRTKGFSSKDLSFLLPIQYYTGRNFLAFIVVYASL